MSNACGERSPDGKWRCSFLPPHGPRHSWERFSEPAVLLRDTPEGRERLAQAIRRAEYPDTEHGANYRDDRKADAIIAALRGEG